MTITHICIQWKDGNDEYHDVGERLKSHFFAKEHGLFKDKYVAGTVVAIDVNDSRVRYTLRDDEGRTIYEVVPLSSIDILAYTEAG